MCVGRDVQVTKRALTLDTGEEVGKNDVGEGEKPRSERKRQTHPRSRPSLGLEELVREWLERARICH